MSDRAGWRVVAAVLLVVSLLLYVGWLTVRWRECSDSGGRYLRGVLTMECIHDH